MSYTAVIFMCPYRAEHEYGFIVQHHELSSSVIAGVGFELVVAVVK